MTATGAATTGGAGRSAPTGPRVTSTADRGLSASTQFATILPALMLLMLGLIQAGIWLHARNVTAEAADAAADVARSYGGADQAAQRVADHVAAVGGLQHVTVTLVRSATTLQVTVTGRPPVMFDLGLGAVSATATAPVERMSRP